MIAFVVVVACILVMFLTKGIFSPAKLFALMWTFLILGYYIFSSKSITGIGLLWIAASMIVLAVGENIGVEYASKRYKAINNIGNKKVYIPKASSRHLFKALVLIIFIALLGPIINLFANGYNLSYFFDINKFMSMNTAMAYDRYNGETNTNYFITLLSSFCYVAPLCGGYLLPYSGKRKRRVLLCFLSFFPILFLMLIENTKSGVIDAAILFVIGFMVAFMKLHKSSFKLDFKKIALIICLAFLLFALLFATMCVRIGDFSAGTIAVVKEKFIVYAFGSVEAFDVWLTKHYTFGTYGFGINTFMAPFNLLGFVNREQGVYGFIDGVSSNVFSAFRGVILDFGVVGGLLFMFVIGIVGGIAYKKIRICGTVGAQFIYVAISFFLIRSFLISPWIYTSFWVVFIVFLLFIQFASGRTHRRVAVKRKQLA